MEKRKINPAPPSWCGIKRWSADYSLNFKANDDNADFGNRTNLGNANDNYSGGLVLLGLLLNFRKSSKFIGLFLLSSSVIKRAEPAAQH